MNADLVMCVKPCTSWTCFASFSSSYIFFYVMIKRAFAFLGYIAVSVETNNKRTKERKNNEMERYTVYDCKPSDCH